jgi:ABC-type phosphate transport system substrate-binding protein
MHRYVPSVLLSLALLFIVSAGTAFAAEPIAVIVASSQTKRVLSLEDLALIYRRKKLYWPDGSKIVPINLPASSATRRSFSDVVFNEPVEASESYWNSMYFQGVSPPFVAASDEAVMRFVAQSSNALGYVPLCSADKRVNVILVLDSNGVVSNPQAALNACSHP